MLLGAYELQGKQLDALASSDPQYLWARADTKGYGDFSGLGWRVLVRQPATEALAP